MTAGRRLALGGAVACAAVAAVSVLVIPVGHAYDPAAWLTWGHEVARLRLDTTGGPSWKPLPVLVTTVLSPTGRPLSSTLWLIAARAGALAAVVGCAALARRLVGPGRSRTASALAAVVAGGLLVLTPDDHARFVSLTLEGHTAPLTAALAVWAVERHLAGRPGWTWVLALGLALDRPEAWPFVAAYGLWLLGRRSADVRWWAVVGGGLLVPVLWFGGDLWGSGDLVHGAGVAAVFAEDPNRVADAAARLGRSAAGATWALAVIALVVAGRRRDRATLATAGLASAWVGVVVGMCAVLGYAAVGRFLLPGTALVCAVAGVGAARLVVLVGERWHPVLAVAVAGVVVATSWSRIDLIGLELDRVAERERTEEEIERAIEAAGGTEAVASCGRVVNDEGTPGRPSMAWLTEVRLDRSKRILDGQPGVVFDRRGTPSADALEAATDPEVRVLARTEEWLVVAIGCDSTG